MKSILNFIFSVSLLLFSKAGYSQLTFLSDPNPSQKNYGSNPRNFVEFKDEVYFFANDRLSSGLWKSNGTDGGTLLVKRFNYLGSLVVLNNELIITGMDNTLIGIWKSDGTEEGTVFVKRITKFPSYLDPDSYQFSSSTHTVKGALYGIINNELWRIDGSSEGTFPIKSSSMGILATIGDTVFFFSPSDDYNTQYLSAYNTVSNETTLLKQFKYGYNTSPLNIVANKSKLYFFANNDTSLLLYSSDGTPEGTVPIYGNSRLLYPGKDLVFCNDTLYFIVRNEVVYEYGHRTEATIFRYAGNNVDTVLHFRDNIYDPRSLISLNGSVLAMVNIRYSPGGVHLYKITGAGAVNTVNLPDVGMPPEKIVVKDSLVYFLHGSQIWQSNGTDAMKLNIGTTFYELGKKNIYFISGDDGISGEPWICNLNGENAHLIKDINQELYFSGINNITASNDKVYFSARNDTLGNETWISDGSPEGTSLLKDIYTGSGNSNPHQYFSFGNQMYFIASEGTSNRTCFLWKSDGTSSGTVPLKQVYHYFREYMSATILFHDKFYFGGVEFEEIEEYGYKYYRPVPGIFASDGSPENTSLLKSVYEPWKGKGYPTNLTRVGDSFFFITYPTSERQAEIWKSDGTESGTVIVKSDFPIETTFNFVPTLGTSNLFYFVDEYQPWVSDGTKEGTHILTDKFKARKYSYINLIGSIGDKVFFCMDNGEEGYDFFVSDGTSDGTILLSSFIVYPSGVYPSGATEFNEKLYFAANDSVHGWELWCTDGTLNGTYMVKEVIPGTVGGIGSICISNDLLYFSINNPDGTSQIWRTDGTYENTVPLDWNAHGVAKIANMTSMGNYLVFSASDETHGECLYAYELDVVQKITDVTNEGDFQVYPNPAEDLIHIKMNWGELAVPLNFDIISMDGAVMKSFILNSDYQNVNVSNLPPNMYIIRTKNGKENLSKRFIKK